MSASGWMPGAHVRPVVNHSGPMSADLGLVLHVCEGDGSQFNWFNNPSAQASSHFWVGKDGTIEQYVPAGTKAWAQANGNADYHSVETEGFTNEPLTAAQIQSVARIFQWGGWPRQLADVPGQQGLAWHGMGGASWGGHYGCPGDIRKNQRADILRAAGGNPGPPPAPLGSLPLSVDGDFGPQTVAATQRACGAAVDGIFGPQSKEALQRHLGVTADGVVGPITVRALQYRVGAPVDGSWGPVTTSALQRSLNARRF